MGGDVGRWLAVGPRTRRALAVYVLLLVAFMAMIPQRQLLSHSPYNHYSLQAAAWLEGRLDLGGPPPSYTGNNDFAVYEGRHYVSFPPVPAVIVTPLVAIAGRPERVRDPQVFAWLAPLGPVFLFLALERLRRSGQSERREDENLALALLLGMGTVFWFSAVQGSVWFAGHVVTMGFVCAYLLFSIEAAEPVLAGLCLALAFGTRPSAGFAFPWFVYQAVRSCDSPKELFARLLRFAAPIAAVLGALGWFNAARFGDPLEFGHRHLQIVWRARIEKWGLFSFHYLPKNLGVILGGLPSSSPNGIHIGGHGLALWITSPFYLWAFWPKRTTRFFWAAAATALAIALPSLLYQNTGWVQFGYRFSNDYAPLLLVMIAIGGRRFRAPFWALCAVAVAVNAFGALTFGQPRYAHFYRVDQRHEVLHQLD